MLVGDVLPIGIAYVNKRFSINIPVEAVAGLMGLSGVYILRQGATDAKEPDKH
jgi:hypothetical protein